MIIRTRYIKKLRELLEKTSTRYIALSGDKGIGIEKFLESISKHEIFSDIDCKEVEFDSLLQKKGIKSYKQECIIIRGYISTNFEDFRTIIEPKFTENKIIFITSDPIENKDVVNFSLPEISFREYMEYRGYSIDISKIMDGSVSIHEMNILRDEYIITGGYPDHIEDTSRIFQDFHEKCTIMKQELFEKEYGEFDEYLRTLAMNVGNLFKADGMAKLIGISRRKVHKYTKILLDHSIIQAIGPWGDDATVETTRHVKLYFTHLFYLRAILGDIYYQGQLKNGIIENFIFLELERKLGNSHDFSFYRKKSGAEITFIITDKENTMITAIEVHLRGVNIVSQVMKIFDSHYHERVERYILFNDIYATKKSLGEKTVMILPHIAI